MKKDFDETLPKQLRETLALNHQQQQDINELFSLIQEKPESLGLLSSTIPWSHFYELPFRTLLTIIIADFGAEIILGKIARSDNHLHSLLEHISDLLALAKNQEELTEEETAFRFSAIWAFVYQYKSIAIHSRPISTLIEQIREGNDEALFDAVIVDRSAISAPTLAQRIQIAELNNDNSFMDKLAKAITRTKPRRPAKELDDVRYMLEVALEELGLKNTGKVSLDDDIQEMLFNILKDDLELYDASYEGFADLIKRRNKKYRG